MKYLYNGICIYRNIYASLQLNVYVYILCMKNVYRMYSICIGMCLYYFMYLYILYCVWAGTCMIRQLCNSMPKSMKRPLFPQFLLYFVHGLTVNCYASHDFCLRQMSIDGGLLQWPCVKRTECKLESKLKVNGSKHLSFFKNNLFVFLIAQLNKFGLVRASMPHERVLVYHFKCNMLTSFMQ